MSDFILKLKMLRWMSWDVRKWWSVVLLQDPDEQICCDGYECGCRGARYGTYWEYLTR